MPSLLSSILPNWLIFGIAEPSPRPKFATSSTIIVSSQQAISSTRSPSKGVGVGVGSETGSVVGGGVGSGVK